MLKISKKRESEDAIREKILDAAFELMKKHGVAHTSLSKMASVLHMSKSTFYKYFASKEEMLYQLIMLQGARSEAAFKRRLNSRNRMGEAEAKAYICYIIERNDTVYRIMTPKDWGKILSALPEHMTDQIKTPQREETIEHMLRCFENVRLDADIKGISSMLSLLIYARRQWESVPNDLRWEMLSGHALEHLYGMIFVGTDSLRNREPL